MNRIILILISFFLFGSINAQITVNNNANASNLANRLVGAGVVVSNATLVCPALASGDFTVTSSNLGLDSGIVLTSGTADSTSTTTGFNGSAAIVPSLGHGAPGDPDLDLLLAGGIVTSNDACILEFDFITPGDSVKFDYVFGSSEYRNFTCSINDVFGFFVSGPGLAGPFSNGAINIATVPGSGNTCPVGVNTIYCPSATGNCCNATTSCHAGTNGCGMFTIPTATCNYFVCNGNGTTVSYPGFTTVLTAETAVQPCETYHIKIAIADASDDILDSGIMLSAGSFTANKVSLKLDTNLVSVTGRPVLIEGCDSLKIDIKIQKCGLNVFDTVSVAFGGSAINGGDYNPIPNFLIFTPDPNDTLRTITIGAALDGITEGTENIILYLQNYYTGDLTDSVIIEIVDDLGVDFLTANNQPNSPTTDSLCLGYEFTFVPYTSPIVGVGPLRYDWDFGDGTTALNAALVNQRKTYSQPGIYSVKLFVQDSTGCQDSMTHSVFVDFPPFVTFTASPLEVCTGDRVYFVDSVAPGTLSTTYDFGDGNVLFNLDNPIHTYEEPGVYPVTFSGYYRICPALDTTFNITVNDYPLINLGEDLTYCPALDSVVILRDMNNPSQIMTWSTGESASAIVTKKTGRYWATIDNQGCSTTDSIWVKRDCYLNLPNSFSPNGDGRNDYFIPRQMLSSGLIEFDMKIVNRWGEIIFQTDKIDGRGWGGKYGNQEQPVGVYVYQITARWKNNYRNSFTGNVTLLR